MEGKDIKEKKTLKKSKKIIFLILVVIIIIGIIFAILFKPKYELNKAISYLKYGEYKKAYEYIEKKENNENKIIIKELITQCFCDRISSGLKKSNSIVSECTALVYKINMNNIDYTLDDNINIDVEGLDSYISLENEITKDMIIDELSTTYDLYFKQLKYMRENFYDILNRWGNEDFINEIKNLASDMIIVSNETTAVSDNYKFNPKSKDIYEKISKYIVK